MYIVVQLFGGRGSRSHSDKNPEDEKNFEDVGPLRDGGDGPAIALIIDVEGMTPVAEDGKYYEDYTLYTLEKDKRYLDHEQLYIINDGEIVAGCDGGKSSVGLTDRARAAIIPGKSIMTHNHPREKGRVGGTFSCTDIAGLTMGYKQIRAAAKECTYVLEQTGSSRPEEFAAYVTKNKQKIYNEASKARDLVDEKKYLTQEEFNDVQFNKMLESMDSIWEKLATSYGYKYYKEEQQKWEALH